MQGGDLAVGLSRRIFVHVDTFRTVEPGTRKLFKVISVPIEVPVYDKVVLNRWWHFTSRTGIDLCLFSFPDIDLDKVVEDLDQTGLNPFHFHETFPDGPTLARDLAYLPGVLGVSDLAARGLMYGSYYLTDVAV